MATDLLLVEEVEATLAKAIEGGMSFSFEDDNSLVDNFILGQVLNDFSVDLHKRIGELDNAEAAKFLSLSLAQFKTHNPENRKSKFLHSLMPGLVGNADLLWNRYHYHFHEFETIAIRTYELFKSGQLGRPLESSLRKARLKMNLSVPEIALLFKMINELKPTIIDVKSDADLYRFISENFETKKSGEEGISTDKLRNLFSKPEPKAADFWQKHLSTMSTDVKRFK